MTMTAAVLISLTLIFAPAVDVQQSDAGIQVTYADSTGYWIEGQEA